MKNNTEIAVYKESIFDKIKKFFKNIFKKKNNFIEDSKEAESVNVIENKDEFTETFTDEYKETLEERIENDKKKQEVFRIYDNVKSGKCKLEDLAMPDLINVMILLNEEKKLYN